MPGLAGETSLHKKKTAPAEKPENPRNGAAASGPKATPARSCITVCSVIMGRSSAAIADRRGLEAADHGGVAPRP